MLGLNEVMVQILIFPFTIMWQGSAALQRSVFFSGPLVHHCLWRLRLVAEQLAVGLLIVVGDQDPQEQKPCPMILTLPRLFLQGLLHLLCFQ